MTHPWALLILPPLLFAWALVTLPPVMWLMNGVLTKAGGWWRFPVCFAYAGTMVPLLVVAIILIANYAVLGRVWI